MRNIIAICIYEIGKHGTVSKSYECQIIHQPAVN
jgi:hypothetical protein